MQAKAVEFKIEGSEDLVLHEGKVKTVGDVYNEKLAKDFNFRAHQKKKTYRVMSSKELEERHTKKKKRTPTHQSATTISPILPLLQVLSRPLKHIALCIK